MTNTVIKRESEIITGLGGACCVPIAWRIILKTIMTRRKQVVDIKKKGIRVITPSDKMRLIEVLKLPVLASPSKAIGSSCWAKTAVPKSRLNKPEKRRETLNLFIKTLQQL